MCSRFIISGKPIPVAPLIGIGYQALRRFFATVQTRLCDFLRN
jgi:hypothetical protein